MYDEALVLIRATGEIANLLWLFVMDRPSMNEWKNCDRDTRLGKFGPGAVRRAI
jgi:hypothetical protein